MKLLTYRAVGNRCAVHLDSLRLQIPHTQIIEILSTYDLKIITVDIISHARECISSSTYRRGARTIEAPQTVDCSSLIKWLYGLRGIWLPRRSIQQRELGESININQLAEGDVVFKKGFFDWYIDDPADSVGHVGIATGSNSIIHAASRKLGIIESPLQPFIGDGFRGVRRYIPLDCEVITFEIPSTVDIETSDDFRWLVLQKL